MRYRILSVILIMLDLSDSSNASTFISKLEISDEQYFHHNPLENTYNFGYDINADGTFHHQRRGQDGVTYGCYGYIDPNGKLHATHYVSDRRGYRVVEPNRAVPIFLDNQDDFNDSSKDSRFEVRPWHALILPKGCGRSISVHPGTAKGPELIYKPPALSVTTASTTISSDQPSSMVTPVGTGSSTEHTRAPPFFWLFTTTTTSTAAPTTLESATQNQRSPCACGGSSTSRSN